MVQVSGSCEAYPVTAILANQSLIKITWSVIEFWCEHGEISALHKRPPYRLVPSYSTLLTRFHLLEILASQRPKTDYFVISIGQASHATLGTSAVSVTSANDSGKSTAGYLYSVQCKWRKSENNRLGFGLGWGIGLGSGLGLGLGLGIGFGIGLGRVRVRLFSPLRHLHCAEYRKLEQLDVAQALLMIWCTNTRLKSWSTVISKSN